MEIYISVSCIQIIETRNLGIFSANALALSSFILYTHIHTNTQHIYVCVYIYIGFPWTARRSILSILKKISPEYPLEGQVLKLKLQYFGHLMGGIDSLEKTLMLGKIEGRRRRGWQRIRWLDGIPTWWTWVWASSGIRWWTEKPGILQSMGLQRVRHNWATELNWTEIIA